MLSGLSDSFRKAVKGDTRRRNHHLSSISTTGLLHSLKSSMLTSGSVVTRSHKSNDRDHVALADGTAPAEEHLPRYFAKSGHVDADPKKVKKEGGGKGNWYHIPY